MVALSTGAKEVYTFRDHKAFTAKMIVYVANTYANTGAQGGALRALAIDLYAMQTGNTMLDNDGATPIIKCHGAYTTQASPWTNTFNSTGDYKSVSDKAVMVFQDAAGVVHKYQIPCPLASVFSSDQQTVDPTAAVVKQFVADMLFQTFGGTAPTAAVLHPIVSASGFALTSFVGGFRAMRKMQRKFNIYTLNPALNGPGE